MAINSTRLKGLRGIQHKQSGIAQAGAESFSTPTAWRIENGKCVTERNVRAYYNALQTAIPFQDLFRRCQDSDASESASVVPSLSGNSLTPTPPHDSNRPALPQKVFWQHGNDGSPVGLVVDSEYGREFIPWEIVKREWEQHLLILLVRILGDAEYRIATVPFRGRENWRVRIFDKDGIYVASIWAGNDPHQGWRWDGLVRVGTALNDYHHKVWQIFQRFTDGTYRNFRVFDRPEDRVH